MVDTLLNPFAPCRRISQRATVREGCYTICLYPAMFRILHILPSAELKPIYARSLLKFFLPFVQARFQGRTQAPEKEKPCHSGQGKAVRCEGRWVETLANTPENRLAKPGKRAYIQREPRFLLRTETGAGAARVSRPRTVAVRGYFQQPRPTAYGPWPLLSGFSSQ